MSDALEQLNEYHRFMGWFLTEFANLEHLLRQLLLDHSGLSPAAFEVLQGFPRTSEVLDRLKKLIKLRGLTSNDLAAVDDAATQLKGITKLRDWIVHYGGHPVDGGQFLIRLKPTERSDATGKAFHLFTRDELWSAVQDFHLVRNILRYRLDRHLHPEHRKSLEINGVRNGPWRYTPPKVAPAPS